MGGGEQRRGLHGLKWGGGGGGAEEQRRGLHGLK